jgi:hypothetical protein
MNRMRRLLGELSHPMFLLFDAAGIAFCALTVLLPVYWHPFFFTLGSVLLTIGITLPAAVFFQSISNEQAFKILNACNSAGIESIFVSRKQDAADLRQALNLSLSGTKNISLLGVAFRTFFDPSAESRETLSKVLNSTATRLRVLILNPKCTAAIARDQIELGNATIADIEHTANNGLHALAVERLLQLKNETTYPHVSHEEPEDFAKIDRQTVAKRLNMEVRFYSSEPVAFLMIFGDAMYSEQYHRGRPPEVPIGSCIGKYMPVLKFRRESTGFKFLESHFERIWAEADDITLRIVDAALKKLPTIESRSPVDNGLIDH